MKKNPNILYLESTQISALRIIECTCNLISSMMEDIKDADTIKRIGKEIREFCIKGNFIMARLKAGILGTYWDVNYIYDMINVYENSVN